MLNHPAFLIRRASGPLQVVAAGSGTKCLGASRRGVKGDTLNDCHAEVVARRSLVAWLYSEAVHTVTASDNNPAGDDGSQQAHPFLIFDPKTGVLSMASDTSLHMFVSRPPCGDACCDNQLSHGTDDDPTSCGDGKLPGEGT